MFLWICCGAAPFLIILLLYNHAITGHALQNTMQWGYVELHIASIGSLANTAFLRNTAKQIIENIRELVMFSSFFLLILYGLSLSVKASKRPAILRFLFHCLCSRVRIISVWSWKPIWPSVLLRRFPVPYINRGFRGAPYHQQHQDTHRETRDRACPHYHSHIVALLPALRQLVYL